MKIDNIEIIPCIYMSDNGWEERTRKERIFTFPWRPLKKFKVVDKEVALTMYMGQFIDVYVTFKMYAKLEKNKEKLDALIGWVHENNR